MEELLDKPKPEFPRVLFWDVNPDAIDWQKHARFVVSRVLHRGTLADWKELRRFYTDQTIQRLLPKIRWQDPKTENFFKHFYQGSF